MKKIFKKVTSVFVAAVMATSMVVSAGAGNWSLTTTTPPGMPSNVSNPNEKDDLVETTLSETGLDIFTSICNSYTSAEDANGNLAYVKFYCEIANARTGGDVLCTTTNKYHRQSNSRINSNLSEVFKYGRYARVHYTLIRPSGWTGSANMSGTSSFSN